MRLTKEYIAGLAITNFNKHVFVSRSVAARVLGALTGTTKCRNMCAINAARQTGKSSLVNYMDKVISDKDTEFFILDCRVFGNVIDQQEKGELATESDVALAILFAWAKPLGLDIGDIQRWFEEKYCPLESKEQIRSIVPGAQMLSDFATDKILPSRSGKRVVFVFDEFDVTIRLSFGGDFILHAMEELCAKSDSPFSSLFVSLTPLDRLIHSSEAGKYAFIESFTLDDFEPTDRVLEEWAEGFHPYEGRAETIAEVLRLTGGHPFYVGKILANAKEISDCPNIDEVSLIAKQLVVESSTNGFFVYPEEILAHHGGKGYTAVTVYQSIRDGGDTPASRDPDTDVILLMSGLVRRRAQGWEIRSPIFNQVFDSTWCGRVRYQCIVRQSEHLSIASETPDETKPLVYLINCGGTLGMELQPKHNVVAEPKSNFYLLERFHHLTKIANVEPLEFRPRDGANIGPGEWDKLADYIYELWQDKGDKIAGFVVVHGTDTLCYTASALAFMLGGDLPFPVVFTGSQATAAVLHGDAASNITRAVVAAASPEMNREVLVCFDAEVHRAVHAEKLDDFNFRGFHSPSNRPVAVIGERVHISSGEGRRKGRNYFMNWELRKNIDLEVARLSFNPGTPPKMIDYICNYDGLAGVVIETLGLGNIPTEEPYSWVPAIEKLVQRNIPVVMSSRYPIDTQFTSLYEPAKTPERIGAIASGNMTPAAVLTKLMWCLGQWPDLSPKLRCIEVKKMMEQNFVNEMVSDDTNITGRKIQ